MRLIDITKLSLQNLNRTRFRSFLTTLGVIIGISAIVLFVSLGIGLQSITANQIASFNALTTVNISQTPATATMEEGSPLTNRTVDQLKAMSEVERVSPTISLPSSLSSDSSSTGGIVYGVEKDNQDLDISFLDFGGKFSNDGECVISLALGSALSGDPQGLIGKKLKINTLSEDNVQGLGIESIELTIVGIDNNETSNNVYTSINTVKKLVSEEKYSMIKVKVKDRDDVDIVKDRIKSWGYQVTTIKDLVDQIDKFFLLVQIILGVVSGIGLLVSSLGIINTMTISLLERTREIGIMKAIGATNKDIKRLFFTESALIGFFGGVIGVGLAYGTGKFVNFAINFFAKGSGQEFNLFITPTNFAFLMIVFAMFISMFAGYYPARRAQRLPLIVALYQ